MFTRRPRRVALDFDGPASVSLTKQSFAKDADINVLMNKYKRPDLLATAMSAIGSPRVPRFGDFSDLPDYPTMCQQMRLADESFAALPAVVRDRFGNSVEACLDFMSKPENLKESVSLGLLPKELLPVEVPKEAPVLSKVSVEGAPAVEPEPTPVPPAS